MKIHYKLLFSLSLVAALGELCIMVSLNRLLPVGLDYLVLLVYLLVPYLIFSSLILLLFRIIHPGLPGGSGSSSGFEGRQSAVITTAGFIFALNIASGLLRLVYFDSRPSSRWKVVLLSGSILVVLAALSYLTFRNYDRLGEFFHNLRLGPGRIAFFATVGTFFVFTIGTFTGGNHASVASQADLDHARQASMEMDGRPRILIVGLDGMSFDTIERLSRDNRVPNLQALIDDGSSGRFETVIPTLSPMLWTSIASGKVASKHGIHDFKTVKLPGVRPFSTTLKRVEFGSLMTRYLYRSKVLSESYYDFEHYTSSMRRCKNVWNILSENGRRVGVIGWYVTWPSEPVNGFMVSERAFLYSNEGGDIDPGLTYPEELFSQIARYNIEFSDIAADSLDWLCEPPEGGGSRWREGCMETLNQYLGAIRKNYARDLTILRVSEHMMALDDSWDVMMLYFRAVDSMNHVVFHEVNEEGNQMGDSLYIIPDNYYEFVDSYVGDIVRELDDNTTLMIMSDHGWEREVGHPYAPPGILLLHGKYIKKGFRLVGVNIFDIAPTVLYLQGLPIAEDMDGRPALSCIDEGFVARNPIRYITTYENGDRTAIARPLKSKVDNAMDEQLKALGYIQ